LVLLALTYQMVVLLVKQKKIFENFLNYFEKKKTYIFILIYIIFIKLKACTSPNITINGTCKANDLGSLPN
jgi:hypothetical protein